MTGINNSERSSNILKQTGFTSRLGLFLWVVALLFMGWKVVSEPGSHTVVHHYLSGGHRWVDRADLYTGPHGFIYMPLFAVGFSLFTSLSEFWTDVIWRIIQISVLFYSFLSLVRVIAVGNQRENQIWHWFGLVSLIALPIAFSGLRNGQMNVVLSAVMVLLTAWVIEKRWMSAALLLAFVMSLKPTFAVFFLLVVALYKPLWWRTPPMLLGFLVIPAIVGGWDYGGQQYLNFIAMGKDAMELGMEEPNWATFFNIAPQLFDVYVPESIQLIVKLSLAVLTLLVCHKILKSSDSLTGAVYLLTFACCYHMLFNPRSVNTDYVIIGSVMAFWFACAVCLWKDRMLAWLVGINALTILMAYELSKLITPDHHSWVNPLATLIFTVLMMWQVKKDRRFLV